MVGVPRGLLTVAIAGLCVLGAAGAFAVWASLAGHDDVARIHVLVVEDGPDGMCVEPADDPAFGSADYGGCFVRAGGGSSFARGSCVEARVPYRAEGEDRVIEVLDAVDSDRCNKD